MSYNHIIERLPYARPFLFVDKLLHIDDESSSGQYHMRYDDYFLTGHFPGDPIVPGEIITEIMVQIGMVCLYIHLLTSKKSTITDVPALTESKIEFLGIVRPGDTLTVKSKMIYFRFGKLKCSMVCHNQNNELVAKGECSGMILNKG